MTISNDRENSSRKDETVPAPAESSSGLSDAPTKNGVHRAPFTLRDKPIHANRHMRVIVIGAGASGLYMAYKLKHYFTDFSLDVYEKNPEIGGTWYENRYPGCACDVPALNYTYTFEPKPDWSANYASSNEIFNYFSDFVKKYHLDEYITCGHEVTDARWDENEWVVTVQKKGRSVFEQRCDFLINASGILNKWRYPAIPGLQSFQGDLVHSAAWDDSIQLKGKHVGLIGNGSSGVQILPQVQKVASHVTTFIREPTWISPAEGMEYHVYTEEEKRRFREEEGHLLSMRRQTEHQMSTFFPLIMQSSAAQADAKSHMRKSMQQKLNNPDLANKLIPDFAVGCRRLTPGVNYLETLGHHNVTTIYGEITEVTPKGVITDDGNETAVDVLICATGFDTTFKPRFSLVGRNKDTDLAKEWALEPRSYLGLAAHGYPNYFMFLGPNCPIGNGPIIFSIEVQGEYIAQILNRWQKEDIHSVDPKIQAVDDFMEQKDAFMPYTVWDSHCLSWYKDTRSGKITALWPGSHLHYMEALSSIRWDDSDVRYNGNRFAYLGNGFGQIEFDSSADRAYYIRDRDDGTLLGRNSMSTLNAKDPLSHFLTSKASEA